MRNILKAQIVPKLRRSACSASAALILTLAGCGGGSVAEEPEAQKPNPFIVDQYLDYELKTSLDLSKGVFISGRNLKGKDTKTKKGESKIAQNTKVYKVDLASATPTPARVTDADIGSEQQVALSADGKWVAILARKGGSKKLYIQSYAKPGQRLEITGHAGLNQDIRQIAFSRSSNKNVLGYRTAPTVAGGKRMVFLVAVDSPNDDIPNDFIKGSFKMEAEKVADIAFGELATATDSYDVILKDATTAANGETSYTFSRYTFGAITNGMGTPGAVTTDAKLVQLTGNTVVTKDNGLYLIESLTKGQDATPVTPIGDGLNKPKLDNLGNALSLTLAASSTKTIVASKITNPISLSLDYDASAMVLLGEETIDCREIGRFNTTAMAFRVGTGEFKRLYMTEDGSGFGLQLAEHSCELMRQKAKVNDKVFREARLAKAADGFYHLFVQSSYFGDIEIYRFKFKVSGDALTDVSFLNVSNNRKP